MRRTAHHAPVRTTSHCTTTVNGLANVEPDLDGLMVSPSGLVVGAAIGTVIQAGLGAGVGALAGGKGRRARGALIGGGILGGLALVGSIASLAFLAAAGSAMGEVEE